MNIFHDLEGILAPQNSEQSSSVMDLLQLAADIRTKLGNQGHLIERYLSDTLQALTATSSFQSSEAGFEESAKLRNLCFLAMDSKKTSTKTHSAFLAADDKKKLRKHPFYPLVKKHFEKYPDTLRFRFAIVNRHYAMLSKKFLQFSLPRFIEMEKDKISHVIDRFVLNELYAEITAIIGETPMEQLNHMLREQFLAVPVSIGFAYGLSCALLDSLAYVDNETGKQIFQLLMDECSKEK